MGKKDEHVSGERAKEWLEHKQKRSRRFGAMVQRWVDHTSALAEKIIVEEPPEDLCCLFMIRLGGIVADLWNVYREPLPDGTSAESADLRADVVAGLESIRTLFTRDEMIYIEVRRNEECHPILRKYEGRLSDEDKWRDADFTKVIGENVKLDVDEVLKVCDEIDAKHGSPNLASRDFAHRSYSQVRSLGVAMRRLFADVPPVVVRERAPGPSPFE